MGKKVSFIFLILLTAVLFAVILAMVVKIFGPELSGAGGTEDIESVTEEVLPSGETEAYEDGSEETEEEALQETVEEAPAEEEIMGTVIGEPSEGFGEEEEDRDNALLQSGIDFSFDDTENDVWAVTVTVDGESRNVLVPVMVNGSGEMILADGYRKIVCVEESENGEGDLAPCVLDPDSPDEEAVITYSSFIEICDLLGTMGWNNWGEDEEIELSDELISSLDSVLIPGDRLKFIGDIENYHLFRFYSGSSGEEGYQGLFRSVSGIFGDSEGGYALVVK